MQVLSFRKARINAWSSVAPDTKQNLSAPGRYLGLRENVLCPYQVDILGYGKFVRTRSILYVTTIFRHQVDPLGCRRTGNGRPSNLGEHTLACSPCMQAYVLAPPVASILQIKHDVLHKNDGGGR